MNDNSKEAYENITPRLGLHHEQILSHLPDICCYEEMNHMNNSHWFARAHYPVETFIGKGMATCEAIGNAAGMTEYQVNRRIPELIRMGLVEKCEERYSYKGSDGRTYHKSIYRAK